MEITPQRMVNKRNHYGEEILVKNIGEKYLIYREKWNKAGNREIITDFPLYIQFELMPHCNLSCCSCLHGQKELSKEYVKIENILDDKLFNKVIDEASSYGCPSISFHNNSEPLLDKQLGQKIRLAKKAGIFDIIVVTNATLLAEEKSLELLNSGVTKITFSIDAFSDETYRINREKSDFNLVKSNIFTFLKLKKELNLEVPITRVSFVVNKNNHHEMQNFKEFWEDKVDLVDFQNFSALEGYTENLCPPGFKPIIIDDFVCNSPWQQVVIRANGDVLPCCSLYGAHVVLGNISNSSIYDIWNGEIMNTLREELMKGQYTREACQRCVKTFYVSSDK